MTPTLDLEASFDLESCEAITTGRMHDLSHPYRRGTESTLAQDWLRIRPLVRVRPTSHDRKVFLLHFAPFKNDAKFPCGKCVLGDQHQPARVTIEAVHNRWF